MYSLIGFSNAVVVDAIVLKATKNRMRIVVPGLDDAIELRRNGPQWFSENGETVSFEFLASNAPEVRTAVAPPLTSGAAG